jgi:peptide/nickel transport system substrate-binding protein
VDAQVILQQESDLQSTIAFHNYDALLYGISVGTDPDVFAYWHSSQADPRSANRLNFSEYKSNVADASLEGGRARVDPVLRAVKYKAFLDAWRNDVPAIAFYQPRFLYISQDTIYNFNPRIMNTPADRYTNVQNWMTREKLKSD